jgi:Phage integrase family
MNNNGWQKARREAGLRYVRVHGLRHTFACRLRAAGVSDEDRCALLGHATHTMSGHYASGDLGRLMREANLVLNRQETRTVLRIVAGRFMSPKTAHQQRPCNRDMWINGPTEVPRLHGRLVFASRSLICGAAGRIRTHDPLVRSQVRAAPHRASWFSASINSCRVVQSSARAYLPKSYPA